MSWCVYCAGMFAPEDMRVEFGYKANGEAWFAGVCRWCVAPPPSPLTEEDEEMICVR